MPTHPGNHFALVGPAILALAVVVGGPLYGRSRASVTDRKRIRKYRALPARKFRLGFDFWGRELRAVSLDDSATENDALELAKFFWFARGALRPDCGAHSEIVFRDGRGRPLTRVGIVREPGAEYRRTLYVFGDPYRPVKPMKAAAVETIRDLEPVDGKTVI